MNIYFPFQANDYWVSVHTLRTVTEDSILDPDDTLCDVVDDREQVGLKHTLNLTSLILSLRVNAVANESMNKSFQGSW